MITDHPARQWAAAYATEYSDEALFADGFDDAIIGMAERCSCPVLVVYDAERCIQLLMERQSLTYDDALEHFRYNTLGAAVGECAPLFLWRYDPDDEPS